MGFLRHSPPGGFSGGPSDPQNPPDRRDGFAGRSSLGQGSMAARLRGRWPDVSGSQPCGDQGRGTRATGLWIPARAE